MYKKNIYTGFVYLFFIYTAITHPAAALAESAKAQPRLETKTFTIERAGGGSVPVRAELARTDKERQRGLMFRTALAEGEGMLFIFEYDERLSFWMKNTLLPLSIAYISRTGEIIDILDMEPHRTSPVRASRAVRYALEVPQGWFRRAGIQVGDYLRGL